MLKMFYLIEKFPFIPLFSLPLLYEYLLANYGIRSAPKDLSNLAEVQM